MNRNLARILIAACILAGAKFVVRGPARVASASGDFRAIYLPSRAWLGGLDPYDHNVISRVWTDAGQAPEAEVNRWGAPSVYPPTALAIVSPIAAMPWRLARLIWCVANIAALAILILCLQRIAGLRMFENRSLCLIAGMLAFEPVSTTIALGQPSIIVTALAAASILFATRERDVPGGILEGLALVLKPQLAIAFAAPYVLARRSRYCAAAAVTVAIVGAVALLRLGAHGDWLGNYISNVRFAFGPGGTNDPGPTNPNRVEFINLGYLFSLFFASRALGEGLAWAIGLALAWPSLRELSRMPKTAMILECIALLAAVELLVFYHKAYDAVALAFPMAWALSAGVSISESWPVLLTLACYILPGGVAVEMLGQSRFVLSAVSASSIWQTIIVPYQVWALLIMAGWMSYSLNRSLSAAASRDARSAALADCD